MIYVPSGVTPADLLAASMVASHFPTCIIQQGYDAGFDQETYLIKVHRDWLKMLHLNLFRNYNETDK